MRAGLSDEDAEALFAALDVSIRRLLLIAPPGHAKSTWVRMFIEWCVGRHPDWSVILVMATATQAELQLDSIRTTIESNAAYREVFPAVLPDTERGWTRSQIFVTRQDTSRPDPTVLAVGVMGPIQGRRADLEVVDDPTDQDDANSDAVMSTQKAWDTGVLSDRLLPHAGRVDILTRWSEKDLAAWKMASGRWTVLHQLAIGYYCTCGARASHVHDTHGRVTRSVCHTPAALWPTEYPLALLEQKRMDKGSTLFELTYQGNTEALGGNLFKREHFVHAERVDESTIRIVDGPEAGSVLSLSNFRAMVGYVDLNASTKTSSDFFAYATVAYDGLHFLILDVLKGKPEVTSHGDVVADRWNLLRLPGARRAIKVGVESNAYQVAAAKASALKGAPIVEVKNVTDKYTRAMATQPFYESRRVIHLLGAPYMSEGYGGGSPAQGDYSLESGLLKFPRGQHDDDVDAVCGAIALCREAGGVVAAGPD